MSFNRQPPTTNQLCLKLSIFRSVIVHRDDTKGNFFECNDHTWNVENGQNEPVVKICNCDPLWFFLLLSYEVEFKQSLHLFPSERRTKERMKVKKDFTWKLSYSITVCEVKLCIIKEWLNANRSSKSYGKGSSSTLKLVLEMRNLLSDRKITKLDFAAQVWLKMIRFWPQQ